MFERIMSDCAARSEEYPHSGPKVWRRELLICGASKRHKGEATPLEASEGSPIITQWKSALFAGVSCPNAWAINSTYCQQPPRISYTTCKAKLQSFPIQINRDHYSAPDRQDHMHLALLRMQFDSHEMRGWQGRCSENCPISWLRYACWRDEKISSREN